MELRVKRLALGRVALDPDVAQGGDHVGVDVLEPGHQRRGAVAAVAGRHLVGVGQRAIEVVDRGQQRERELGRPALLRGRRLAGGPLAVVLEVGLGALGQRQVLVGLLGLGGELVQVAGRPRRRSPWSGAGGVPGGPGCRRSGRSGAAQASWPSGAPGGA